MEIVVAVKPVPEAETRLRATRNGTGLDPDGVKWVLAGYDESAVEQALLLKEAIPSTNVRAISFAPAPRGEEVLRAAIALGCGSATWVEQPAGRAVDPILAARALAVALQKYPRDLILTGKQSGDDESGLFGSALGAALGVPSFGSVVNLRADAEAHRITFQRPLEHGIENVVTAPPCVVGLQQAWNDPRTAKLPNILKSRKAPIDRVPWLEVEAALGAHAQSPVVPIAFELPPPRTGARLIEYQSTADAARQLVRILREEAKVFP